MSTPARARWPYVFVSAFLGTAIEQYDFLLYGTASALVFNRLFSRTSIRSLARLPRSAPTRRAISRAARGR
ncbi:hypothetical protein [Paraburkholderia terrae]